MFSWTVETMQTIFLTEIFSRFRGRKSTVRCSRQFKELCNRVSGMVVLLDDYWQVLRFHKRQQSILTSQWYQHRVKVENQQSKTSGKCGFWPKNGDGYRLHVSFWMCENRYTTNKTESITRWWDPYIFFAMTQYGRVLPLKRGCIWSLTNLLNLSLHLGIYGLQNISSPKQSAVLLPNSPKQYSSHRLLRNFLIEKTQHIQMNTNRESVRP